jgi:hypothetical protein
LKLFNSSYDGVLYSVYRNPLSTAHDSRSAFAQFWSRERFKELCEHAEVVEDKNKLSKIAAEIDRILDDELERLKNVPLSKPPHT